MRAGHFASRSAATLPAAIAATLLAELVAFVPGVTSASAQQATARQPAPHDRSHFVAPAGSHLVNVVTMDFAFRIPDTIPAGLTTFHLRNDGREPHHIMFYRLEPGKTLHDVFDALEKGGSHPEWMHASGGPNAVPSGRESYATLMLEPGSYVVFCHVKSPDNIVHFMKGMLRAVTVTPSRGAPAPLPVADIAITLDDYSFAFSRPPTRGKHTITVTNSGTQRHELILSLLKAGKTSRDFVTWMNTQNGPPPVTPYGGITDIEPGRTVVIPVDLVPGSYSVVCRVRDSGDDEPHDMHGMLTDFTVP